MFTKKRLRRWSLGLGLTIAAVAIGTLATDRWVSSAAHNKVYNNVADIPHNKVGLLLGTSKYGGGGALNYYYQYRLDAAIALFKAGKIDYILVSGDNGRESYNEPEMFQADLIAAGVPADRIILDFAGFRTLDSIVRCLAVFGEDHVTIISQPFHNERALFLAEHKGLSAVAYNAQDVTGKWGMKTQIREKGARVKMLLDLIFGKEPRFYGPKVKIG